MTNQNRETRGVQGRRREKVRWNRVATVELS